MTPHTPTKPGDQPCLCEKCEEVHRIRHICTYLGFCDQNWLVKAWNRKNERITELEAELKDAKADIKALAVELGRYRKAYEA